MVKKSDDTENKLKELRDKIDGIDDKLLDLLNKRAEVVLKVGHVKGARNEKFYVPNREKKVIEAAYGKE